MKNKRSYAMLNRFVLGHFLLIPVVFAVFTCSAFANKKTQVYELEKRKFYIHCQKLDNEQNSCQIHNGHAQFLAINDHKLMFYEASGCSPNFCIYWADLSAFVYVVGENKFKFTVATVTKDKNLATYHYYKMYMGDKLIHELDSHRRGSNVHKDSFVFGLRLEDIDPEVAEIIDRSRKELREVIKNDDSDIADQEALEADIQSAHDEISLMEKALLDMDELGFDDISIGLIEKLKLDTQLLSNYQKYSKIEKETEIREGNQLSERLRENAQAVMGALDKAKKYNYLDPDLEFEISQIEKEYGQDNDIVEEESDELQSEITQALDTILKNYQLSVENKDLDLLDKTLNKWNEVSRYCLSLTIEDSGLSLKEKSLIYEHLHKVMLKLKLYVTEDNWRNYNNISFSSRKSIDTFIEEGTDESKGRWKSIKSKISFSKFKEAFMASFPMAVEDLSALKREYNNFQPRSTEEFVTKEIALASMEGAEKQILKSLDTGNVDDIKIVSQIISIGRFALDFSTDFIPGVAAGKSVYAVFTGKNFITGESLSSFEQGIEVIGIATGLFGVPSKIAIKGTQRAIEVISSGLKFFKRQPFIHAIFSSNKFIDTAQRIGVTTKEGFGEFVGFTKRTFGNEVGAVGKGLDTDAIESAWKLRKSGISDDAIKTLA